MDSAARYCMFSKFYYSRKLDDIKDYMMFGDGEIHSINTVKMRMLKGKIRKSDILGYLDPGTLYGDFLPLDNIFQNRSVYDIVYFFKERLMTKTRYEQHTWFSVSIIYILLLFSHGNRMLESIQYTQHTTQILQKRQSRQIQ